MWIWWLGLSCFCVVGVEISHEAGFSEEKIFLRVSCDRGSYFTSLRGGYRRENAKESILGWVNFDSLIQYYHTYTVCQHRL